MMPAEVFHPSTFIEEEMAARGWTRDDLASRMGPEFDVNRLAMDLYLDIGPANPGIRIGDGEDLSRAFGVPASFFLELERRWLERQA